MLNSGTARALAVVLKVGLIGLCFAYVVSRILGNLDRIEQCDFAFRPTILLASFPFAVAYLLTRGAIWHLMMMKMVKRFSLQVDMMAWLGSILGKYLPGKVFLFLGRVHLYRRRGVSASQVGSCFIIESGCSVMAACSVFIAAVLFGRGGELRGMAVALIPVVVGLMVFVHPKVLQFGVNTARRLFHKQPMAIRVQSRDVLLWTAIMIVNWLLLGVGFCLLLRSLLDVSVGQYLFVTGAFAVAGIVGMLALFAPSGLGVREGVLTFLLSHVMDPGIAAIAAIVARVWITAAEGLCAGGAFFFLRDGLDVQVVQSDSSQTT